MNSRSAAALVLNRVLSGESLNRALPDVLGMLPESQRATTQALSYGALREHQTISALLATMLKKPIRAKDQLLECFLRIGLFECLDGKTAEHAVVKETVANVKQKFRWAAGLANATLRRYLRERDSLHADFADKPEVLYKLPLPLLTKLQSAWPEQWRDIAVASHAQAPMTLRVDLSRITREQMLAQLQRSGIAAAAHPLVESALTLDRPAPVNELPGFTDGSISVQDAAAQLAAPFLKLESGQKVLDACAAPGGKTIHLLESADIELLAVESDAERVELIKQNFERCQRHAQVIVGDARQTPDWSQGQTFDRILLDAPCSAMGVLRRHPDIQLHRSAADIEKLVQLQAELLDALWALLSPGGRLLYATCSIWPDENEHQVARFIERHPEAQCETIKLDGALVTAHGLQILPGFAGMDGFFYAAISKLA